MKNIRLENARVALITGLAVGVVFIGTVAPSPSPDAPPLDKSYRPNISIFKLPGTLDFCGEPLPLKDPEVQKRMEREFYLNLQWDGQVMLYLKRSTEFFPIIDSILAIENVPTDIKYLAVAESALFMAQSGKGAVGLWQFIPETARRFGLRVDDFVDERRNVIKSTHAAARYLKENRTRFGSWCYAAAAYNMGEAATADDIAFQSGRNVFDLYLNEETSRYLFRIVALKEIMQHRDLYGYYVAKEEYYQPISTTEIAVDAEIINLAQWAESMGTNYKTVKLLNPWILKRSLPKPPAGAPYAISIPKREER